jgi:hypothetical protein
MTTSNLANRIRGKKAKSAGKEFEEVFIGRCKTNGVSLIEIPDGCIQISRFKTIRVKTPFDFLIAHKGLTVALDCKSTSKASYSHSELKEHQLQAIKTLTIEGGLKAGLLIHYRPLNLVSFFNFHVLYNLGPGESLVPYQGDILGTIFDFDVRKLF